MAISGFCIVALVVSALITGDLIFHVNLKSYEKNQDGPQVLSRRLSSASPYQQDVGMHTQVDWLHVWLPQNIQQNYNPVCDPQSAEFQFGNRDKLSNDEMQTLATWIALGGLAWKLVKLLLPVIFPPKLGISPAQEWMCEVSKIAKTMNMSEIDKKRYGKFVKVETIAKEILDKNKQDEKDLKTNDSENKQDEKNKEDEKNKQDEKDLKTNDSENKQHEKNKEDEKNKQYEKNKQDDPETLKMKILQEAYDHFDSNPEDFKANLWIMLPSSTGNKDKARENQAKAMKYVEMCLQKPAFVKVPKVDMYINYPWNRKTQNLIFFAVVAESFLDITLTLFVRLPRLHWFYTDLHWFSLTFRTEIYFTVFYCLARLWVNQWQLDTLAGEGANRFMKFFKKVDDQRVQNKKWYLYSTWEEIFNVNGPMGICCNIHLRGRLVIFLVAILPFLPVTVFTAMGWVGIGCLMAFLWHRVVNELAPDLNLEVGLVLGWASVLCLLAGLWAFGCFWLPAPWYWLEVIFVPAWLLVAFLVGYFHKNEATKSSTRQAFLPAESKPLDQHWHDFTNQSEVAEKFRILKECITAMTNLYLRVYMGLYLVLCIAICNITDALSLYMFPVSMNTYLCPDSQLKIFSTGTEAMGSTFFTIAALMLAVVVGLAIAAKCGADHLDISGWASQGSGQSSTERQSSTEGQSTTLSACVWFYKLWLWESREEGASPESWFHKDKMQLDFSLFTDAGPAPANAP